MDDSELPPAQRRRPRVRGRGIQRLDRPRRVVLRDLIIYELKLLLDGMKGIGISFLALAAVAVDMMRPGERPGHRFYAVMRLGERLDRWLSLYGVAEAAEQDPEGMFGVSRAGSPTLLGRLEALVHEAVVGEEDEPPEEPATAESTEAQASAAATDDDLFTRGIAALDRAVEVLDRERPASATPPPGHQASSTGEAHGLEEATELDPEERTTDRADGRALEARDDRGRRESSAEVEGGRGRGAIEKDEVD